jgi:16S rRNA (guanine(966)-N(2))-methyltransferase RsmD
MRIISGRYKGRLIKWPKGIRPTQDKVRKALFDILGDISGKSFLDLFAGCGAVGIEATSRGAEEVVFVENNRGCLKYLEVNLKLIGLLGYGVIGLDVFQAIEELSRKAKKFDFIFLDPPYYGEAAKKTLQCLSAYDIVAPTGLAVGQHFKKDALPEAAGDLILFRQSRYGDTVLSFYRKKVT